MKHERITPKILKLNVLKEKSIKILLFPVPSVPSLISPAVH